MSPLAILSDRDIDVLAATAARIAVQGPPSLTEIAAHMRFSKTAAKRSVERLILAGFLERRKEKGAPVPVLALSARGVRTIKSDN